MDPSKTPTDDFSAIFRAHAGFVWRVLARLGVAERDLPDVTQDVFVVVHRKLPRFRYEAKVSTWLYRICLRAASDYRRRAARRHEHMPGSVAEAGEVCDAEAQLDHRARLDRLQRALAELPDASREIFVLHVLQGLPMRRVARVVGCPLKTAFSRLYAARRQLRAASEEQGERPAAVVGLLAATPELRAAQLAAIEQCVRERAQQSLWSALVPTRLAGTLAALGALAFGVAVLGVGAVKPWRAARELAPVAAHAGARAPVRLRPTWQSAAVEGVTSTPRVRPGTGERPRSAATQPASGSAHESSSRSRSEPSRSSTPPAGVRTASEMRVVFTGAADAALEPAARPRIPTRAHPAGVKPPVVHFRRPGYARDPMVGEAVDRLLQAQR